MWHSKSVVGIMCSSETGPERALGLGGGWGAEHVQKGFLLALKEALLGRENCLKQSCGKIATLGTGESLLGLLGHWDSVLGNHERPSGKGRTHVSHARKWSVINLTLMNAPVFGAYGAKIPTSDWPGCRAEDSQKLWNSEAERAAGVASVMSGNHWWQRWLKVVTGSREGR